MTYAENCCGRISATSNHNLSRYHERLNVVVDSQDLGYVFAQAEEGGERQVLHEDRDHPHQAAVVLRCEL